MSHLSLVKKLSQIQEEQRHSDEIVLESAGGLTLIRGTIAEMTGRPSAGKTGLMISLLSQLTAAGEICAVVDACDRFDPCSAVLAGVQLENLLWVRCGGEVEKAFMAADHLVQARGFGAIWLNLCGMKQARLRLVPKTYWYRYRTRIKETPTLLLVTAEEPITGSASQDSFHLSRDHTSWSGEGRFKLLRELQVKMQSQKQFYGGPVPAKLTMSYAEI